MHNPFYTMVEKKSVQKILLSWFADNQRDLPWRKDYDPYEVWITEIMGQQTQMERVVLYFNRWMERFPDVTAVAEASERSILKSWEGLGYYSRAKNIQRTARLLVRDYNGRIPDDLQLLLTLPGIGPYTAAAISSLAYNKPCPLLDANVERLFSRLLDLRMPVKKAVAREILRSLAKELLPRDRARMFNQALMEFGAIICTPKSPSCDFCPLCDYCRSLLCGTVRQRPVPGRKIKKIEITMACGIIIHENRVYVQQRLPDDVWGSLWEFPGGRMKTGETPEQAVRREIIEETEFPIFRLRPLTTVVHHYTKYRVTLHGFTCRLQNKDNIPVLHAASQYRWVPFSGLADFPFSAGHRKLIELLGSKI
jgi:A/G-specific adenine glycosylase